MEDSVKKIENKNNAYFIGGINGSGKSTFLKLIAKRCNDFEIVHGSEYLIKWLGLKVGDYDALRSISDKVKDEATDKIVKYIFSHRLSKKPILFDAHYVKIHKGEIRSAIDDWIGLFDYLFFIKSDPATILSRIDKDFKESDKNRQLFSCDSITTEEKLDFISKCLNSALEIMEQAGRKFNIPIFIIENKDDEIDHAIKDFLKIVLN